ncbi:MAG: flagellar type III secretion system protein FliR [Rhodobiaceae bacterium]|nr:flagellar type III secretion system protein FliR [Rhodobiaceae bacterium]MCC0016883.1 flagellar type III secretion system protein FliR [Rhodobiaceae bacterium]MCC0042114.1 flagellar type III secretion system protein FliR [Rhodobiaceae bacterium]
MTVTVLPELAAVFLLIFARLGTLVMLMPGVGDRAVPINVRLVFALVLTLLFYPVVAAQMPALPNSLFGIAVLGGSEMLVGLVIGMSARLILASMQIAGTTIAFQMGLGFALNVDPTQGQQGAIIGTFLSILALTLIFATDLHHPFVMALVQSYTLFQPGEILPSGDLMQVAITLFTRMFVVGVQVSAPFIVFGLVFYLGLGLLSRLMPQIQIFFIAMPANIMLGFVLFVAVLGIVMAWYLDHVALSIKPFLGTN